MWHNSLDLVNSLNSVTQLWLFYYGLFHLIPYPPVEDTCFSYGNTPLKNSKLKTFYRWRIPKFQVQNRYRWRIPSSKPFTREEFQDQTLYPWIIPSSEKFQCQTTLPLKNSKIKTLYLWRTPSSKSFTTEQFQTQNTLPLKNSKLRTINPWRIPSSKPFISEESQGSSTGADTKWNSPICQNGLHST